MKKLALLLLMTTGSAAAGIPLVSDDFIRDSIVLCSAEATLKREPLRFAMPKGFRAEVVTVESKSPYCGRQYVAALSDSGTAYVGGPWFLQGEGSVEEKLRAYAWQAYQETYSAVVDKTATTEGLFPVTLQSTTEYGKVPIQGLVDPAGTVFFTGQFAKPGGATRQRMDALANVIATSPTKGAASAKVTVVEFSDMQCPSCKRAAHFVDPLLEKFGSDVRYVRADLPLVESHPWAFPAAMAGRAIWRQSPDAFWKFKNAIYDQQGNMNAFTLGDFARGFAEDNGLDVKKYDSDVASDEVKKQLLESIGGAYTAQIYGTPTYVVNGMIVDPGADGAALEKYVAGLLK